MSSQTPHNDQEMPLVAHLTELRTRLLRCVGAVFLIFATLFYFAREIYTLVSEPLRRFLPEGATMIAIDPASAFLAPLQLTMVIALFVSMPVILHQVWGFIAPGLYKHEKRIAVPLLTSSVLLFYAGMAFAYFLVLPAVAKFTAGFAPAGVTVSPDTVYAPKTPLQPSEPLKLPSASMRATIWFGTLSHFSVRTLPVYITCSWPSLTKPLPE